MRFFSTSLALITLATSAIAAVTPIRSIETYKGETTGRHIIQLKQGASKDSVLANARLSKEAITHDWDIINGFAGTFSDDILNQLRSNPDVESVSEDGIMHAFTTQTNAPWGIARLSSSTRLSNQDTSYTYTATGSGVDAYVVDTGVRTTHVTFGGRARWGATFGGYANADGNGHGTHCAGTIGGAQYGVSKGVSIIAVKVLSDAGSGAIADIVSGLNYVKSSAASSGRPSIVSMSLGGSANSALDSAVASLTAAGIHVVVAAGNSATDAGSTSPARAPSAITVGATTIADAAASFSNYGSVLDIWAPGQNIISSWATSDTATNNISGTSMATPHVAGLVAYYISRDGNLSPAAMSAKIQSTSLKNVISGVPAGTVNYLAHIA
ncbi:serine proteinase 2 [Crepidotus variabilis]|uniref:Serine proteinase 2 n=1 Tax=Crepidotus variabilis TaxID=179855 RepID=A0A9P6EV09_9AGAR|nr:serine proteinase 2 [Crepidotus variabilis]